MNFNTGFLGTRALISVDICLNVKHLGPDLCMRVP